MAIEYPYSDPYLARLMAEDEAAVSEWRAMSYEEKSSY